MAVLTLMFSCRHFDVPCLLCFLVYSCYRCIVQALRPAHQITPRALRAPRQYRPRKSPCQHMNTSKHILTTHNSNTFTNIALFSTLFDIYTALSNNLSQNHFCYTANNFELLVYVSATLDNIISEKQGIGGFFEIFTRKTVQELIEVALPMLCSLKSNNNQCGCYNLLTKLLKLPRTDDRSSRD